MHYVHDRLYRALHSDSDLCMSSYTVWARINTASLIKPLGIHAHTDMYACTHMHIHTHTHTHAHINIYAYTHTYVRFRLHQYTPTHTHTPLHTQDIKPSNILVDTNNVVSLIDFGLARPLGPMRAPTHTTGKKSNSNGMKPTLLTRQLTQHVVRDADPWSYCCFMILVYLSPLQRCNI